MSQESQHFSRKFVSIGNSGDGYTNRAARHGATPVPNASCHLTGPK